MKSCKSLIKQKMLLPFFSVYTETLNAISVFSLFFFHLLLKNILIKKLLLNNSYELAKKYVQDVKIK